MTARLLLLTLLLAPAAARAQDADAGRAAIERYGCTSCHEVPGLGQRTETSCVGCHQEVARRPRSGFGARPHVEHYLRAPSLEHVTSRLSRDYLVRFLVDPHDVRPRLEETMPRLPVTERDARDIVAYLERVAPARPAVARSPAPDPSRVAEGAEAFRNAGCAACHSFGNFDPGFEVPAETVRALGEQARHAPNLRFVRERMHPDVALAWIRDPRAVDPHTLMDRPGVTAEQALAIRDFLYLASPGAPAPVPDVPRAASLRPLDRAVGWADVRRIFGRSCIHCHAHADDGSSAGALGFEPVALDLSTYEGVLAGVRAPDGSRRSVLEPAEDGTPPLLARLLRRHAEAGRDVVPHRRDTLIRAVRPHADTGPAGMPLGLPPVPEPDLRVLATWIARGAPR